jgi:hypothetical protein
MSHVHTNAVQGIITALQSDGSAEAWPTPTAMAHPGLMGIRNLVSEAAQGTKARWLTSLGKAMPAQTAAPDSETLAVHVQLGVADICEDVPWVINSFPSSYKLFTHRNNAGPQGKLRTDHYLYGMLRHMSTQNQMLKNVAGRYMDHTNPRTSARVYRSPKEFAPHFWWLCNDQQTECACKHCKVERRQATTRRTYGVGGIIARRPYRRANLMVTNSRGNYEHEEEEEEEEQDELEGDA